MNFNTINSLNNQQATIITNNRRNLNNLIDSNIESLLEQRQSNNNSVRNTNGLVSFSNDICNQTKYNLFEQTSNGNKSYDKEATSHYHEETKLSYYYFSEDNINLIQDMIRYAVYSQSSNQYVIGRQSDTELKIIMRSVYLQYGRNDPNNIKEQIAYLNAIVVDEAVKIILPEIEQYNGYIKKITTLPEPIPRSVNMSNKGSKTLQPYPFI